MVDFPRGAYPIGGPIVSTLLHQPEPTQALMDAGALLPWDGAFYRVGTEGGVLVWVKNSRNWRRQ